MIQREVGIHKRIKAMRSPAGNFSGANGAGMPVVLYLRKSNKTKTKSRDETVSIQQQRADLRRWCEARGWLILREYVDDGRSASKNEEKRVEFAKLLADSTNADFRAVVVWDLSRLTRKDSVDAGTAASVLKDNRLLVESLRDGEIDLTTSMGRHIWNLHAEANNAFALKVSAGSIRGKDDSLGAGNWPHGKIPYGYRRQYWDGDRLVQELHRNQKAGKARHWATRIVPDPEEAKYAVKVIRDFATRDVSLRGLAIEMQKAGAPTASGKLWTSEMVKDIIRCPVYVGDTGIGYSWGWRKSVEGTGYEAHNHAEKQTRANACEAVVDRETWQRAFDKLMEGNARHRVHTGKSSPLSGTVICGHCGKRMAKVTKRGVVRFTCATAAKNSESTTCKQWTVQEADLLPIFTERLAEAVDFKLLQEIAAKPPVSDTEQLARLEQQEAELVKKVARAARNLALCEPGVYDDVQSALNDLKGELERVKNTAHLIRNAGDVSELQRIADWWKQEREKCVLVKGYGVRVDSDWPEDNYGLSPEDRPRGGVVGFVDRTHVHADAFRQLLKRLAARITLHFVAKPSKDPNSTRQYYAVEWGRLQAELDGHSFEGCG